MTLFKSNVIELNLIKMNLTFLAHLINKTTIIVCAPFLNAWC